MRPDLSLIVQLAGSPDNSPHAQVAAICGHAWVIAACPSGGAEDRTGLAKNCNHRRHAGAGKNDGMTLFCHRPRCQRHVRRATMTELRGSGCNGRPVVCESPLGTSNDQCHRLMAVNRHFARISALRDRPSLMGSSHLNASRARCLRQTKAQSRVGGAARRSDVKQ